MNCAQQSTPRRSGGAGNSLLSCSWVNSVATPKMIACLLLNCIFDLINFVIHRINNIVINKHWWWNTIRKISLITHNDICYTHSNYLFGIDVSTASPVGHWTTTSRWLLEDVPTVPIGTGKGWEQQSLTKVYRQLHQIGCNPSFPQISCTTQWLLWW